MAYTFPKFRVTKPVVRLIDSEKSFYEVFFIAYDQTGKKHFRRFKTGINCLPVGQRKLQAQANADTLWLALQSGKWNPLEERYPDLNKKDEPKRLLFSDALDLALKIKSPSLSTYSRYDYQGCIRFIKKAAMITGHHKIDINEISRKDIREIIQQAKDSRKWSAHSRNKYLTLLKSLLSALEEEELIPYSPAHKMKNEREISGPGYQRLTDEEKALIASHLLKIAPNYFEFLMFIYQSGIRRTELLQIQISDINLQRRQILISGEKAKTNRSRVVPITDDLHEILISRKVYELPKDLYLFSNSNFLPGKVMYHPNTPTNWWRKYVIKGLGIECKMYSLKHKGADDKIKAGLNIEVLKTLYGHRSLQMTEIYAREVKNQYAQQIIDLSPKFAS